MKFIPTVLDRWCDRLKRRARAPLFLLQMERLLADGPASRILFIVYSERSVFAQSVLNALPSGAREMQRLERATECGRGRIKLLTWRVSG